MVEGERTKKQEYLRESIMNAGYDTDAFLTLMSEKKGYFIHYYIDDEGNIDNWTIEELQAIVKEFIEQVEGKKAVITIEEEKKATPIQDVNVIS